MPKLTAKQHRFVEEYLVDLNATQAAIRVGNSEKTAEQLGYQLLQRTSVAEATKDAQDARAERTEITQQRVLEELTLIGFADMGAYVRFQGDDSIVVDWLGLLDSANSDLSEIKTDVFVGTD